LDQLIGPSDRHTNNAQRRPGPPGPQQYRPLPRPPRPTVSINDRVPEFEGTRRQHHEDQAASNHHVPTSAVRSRIHTGSRLRRRTSSRPQATNPPVAGHTVQQAIARLNSASSDLTTLLAQPVPPVPRIESPDISVREYSGEAEVNRRRKRRKLDNDPTCGMKGFSYGYKGQVVPGQLKMEIDYCDGGLHPDAAQPERNYWPDNVLHNDQSVYCTVSSKCNIILRHMGETCFTLKKLIIKSPAEGFTAPIQEGLIFVTMSNKDILSRTSTYELRGYSPIYSDDDSDPEDMPENRPPSRRREIFDSTSRSVPAPISNSRLRPSRLRRASPSPPASPAPSSYFSPRQASPPFVPSDFTVSTHCNDPSSDEEEPSSAATIADRVRRSQELPPFSSNSDDEDTDPDAEHTVHARALGMFTRQLRNRKRRAEPGRIEAMGAKDETAGERTMLEPHAKFFIEKDKSVVSVSFDPPV